MYRSVAPPAHSAQGPSAATPALMWSAATTSGVFIHAVSASSAAEQGSKDSAAAAAPPPPRAPSLCRSARRCAEPAAPHVSSMLYPFSGPISAPICASAASQGALRGDVQFEHAASMDLFSGEEKRPWLKACCMRPWVRLPSYSLPVFSAPLPTRMPLRRAMRGAWEDARSACASQGMYTPA